MCFFVKSPSLTFTKTLSTQNLLNFFQDTMEVPIAKHKSHLVSHAWETATKKPSENSELFGTMGFCWFETRLYWPNRIHFHMGQIYLHIWDWYIWIQLSYIIKKMWGMDRMGMDLMTSQIHHLQFCMTSQHILNQATLVRSYTFRFNRPSPFSKSIDIALRSQSRWQDIPRFIGFSEIFCMCVICCRTSFGNDSNS